MLGHNQRSTFTETEFVHRKPGVVVLIEGVGKRTGSGDVTHNALAVVAYQHQQRLRFSAYHSGGDFVDAEAKNGDKTLECGFDVPQMGSIRYTIKLNAAGRWFEIGERSADGKTWQKFFENDAPPREVVASKASHPKTPATSVHFVRRFWFAGEH